jgi:hypothetical protein
LDIPASLITQYRKVVLAADVIFVNKIFFVTISRDIKSRTSELLPNQKNAALKNALSHVLSIYTTRGFVIQTVLMVGQFEPLRGDIADLQLTLNTVLNNEHVPKVEHHIQTLKERTRCIYNTVPFKHLLAWMIIEMVCHSTFWLNSFSAFDGISDTLSPCCTVNVSEYIHDNFSTPFNDMLK